MVRHIHQMALHKRFEDLILSERSQLGNINYQRRVDVPICGDIKVRVSILQIMRHESI